MVKKSYGFIAITTVLILISVSLGIAITVSLLSIGEAQTSLVLFKGEDNLSLVEGCVEDALLKIRSNSSYSGGTITRPEGSCTITINSPNPNWDITIVSTSTSYQRKIQVMFIKTSTGLSLTSWKEI